MTPEIEAAIAALRQATHEDADAILNTLRARYGKKQLGDYIFAQKDEKDENKTRPRFRQIAQFLEEVGDPPPMLVERLLPDYKLVIFAGKPKGGKTYTALDAARAVFSGQPVFGEFTVNRPGPVAYLGAEDGEYEFANRSLKHGWRTTHTNLPFYICTERFILNDEKSVAAMEYELMQFPEKPVLLVVDTARECLGIKEWNDPGEVTDKVRALRDFSHRFCSVLLVAHNRKGEADDWMDLLSGTNAFLGAADGVIIAYKKEDTPAPNPKRRLYLGISGRGAMHGEIAVDLDWNTLRCAYVSDADMESEKAQGDARNRAKEFEALCRTVAELEKAGQKPTISAIAEATGINSKIVYTNVSKALQNGAIEEAGKLQTSGRPVNFYKVREGLFPFFPFSQNPIDPQNKWKKGKSPAASQNPPFSDTEEAPYSGPGDDDYGTEEF